MCGYAYSSDLQEMTHTFCYVLWASSIRGWPYHGDKQDDSRWGGGLTAERKWERAILVILLPAAVVAAVTADDDAIIRRHADAISEFASKLLIGGGAPILEGLVTTFECRSYVRTSIKRSVTRLHLAPCCRQTTTGCAKMWNWEMLDPAKL